MCVQIDITGELLQIQTSNIVKLAGGEMFTQNRPVYSPKVELVAGWEYWALLSLLWRIRSNRDHRNDKKLWEKPGLRISILFFFGSSLAFGREIRKMYSEVFSCLIRDSSLSHTLIGRRETCLELNKRKPHCTSVCLLFNSLWDELSNVNNENTK